MSQNQKGKIIAYLIECTDREIEEIEQTENVASLMTEQDWKQFEALN
jgi:hypothetical protein